MFNTIYYIKINRKIVLGGEMVLKNYESPEIYLLKLLSKEDILSESEESSESESESGSGNSNNGSYGDMDGGGL